MQSKFEEFDLYRLFLAVLGYRAEIKRYIEKNDLELPANVLTFQKSLDAQIEELAARFFRAQTRTRKSIPSTGNLLASMDEQANVAFRSLAPCASAPPVLLCGCDASRHGVLVFPF